MEGFFYAGAKQYPEYINYDNEQDKVYKEEIDKTNPCKYLQGSGMYLQKA
jgi:hypothetical protein